MKKELRRIGAAGHFVNEDRVDGTLAMSRALGDLGFKDRIDLKAEEQAVTSFPDVTTRPRSPSDDFLVVACDGIWDCLSNQ